MKRGCMQRNSRKEGPDVWQFRWSETRLDGKRLYHKKNCRHSRANILMKMLHGLRSGAALKNSAPMADQRIPAQ